MNKSKTAPEYIAKHPEHKEALVALRRILNASLLTESIKWGAPVYTFNGENLVAMGAFKSYVGLWFYQGVFLKDPLGVLVNAQEGTTKGLRQWRFDDVSKIKLNDILDYVNEAIENQKAGKKIRPEKKSIAIPVELEDAMRVDILLKSKFETLSKGKQNEYAEYISAAKKMETRVRRLKKSLPLIVEGIGLNDKYR